jgi:hypothetical protein
MRLSGREIWGAAGVFTILFGRPVSAQPSSRSMVVGGIGTGYLRIAETGAHAAMRINPALRGETDIRKGTFVSVWFQTQTSSGAKILQTEPVHGLPTVAAVKTEAAFPQAHAVVEDPTLPVAVTLRWLGPLIPHDLRESTSPSVVLVFTLRNIARAPMDAAVAVSLENILGEGDTETTGPFADRSGNTVAAAVTGGASAYGLDFRCTAAPGVLPNSRLPYNARGTMALLVESGSPDLQLSSAGWNANRSPGWWEQFSREGKVQGTVPAGVQGQVHPAGVVCIRAPLKAEQQRTFAFVIAWHTPRHYLTTDVEVGHFYEKMYDNAVEVGRAALEGRLLRQALVDEWQNRLKASTLPSWLVSAMFREISGTAISAVVTRDSGFGSAEPGPSLFTSRTPVAQAWAVMPVMSSLFPLLYRQELDRSLTAVSAANPVPRRSLETDLTAAVPGSPEEMRRQAAVTAWALWRYAAATSDTVLLNRHYPAVKRLAEETLALPSAETPMQMLLLDFAAEMATMMQDRRFAERLKSRPNLRSTPPRSFREDLPLAAALQPVSGNRTDRENQSFRSVILEGRTGTEAGLGLLKSGDLSSAEGRLETAMIRGTAAGAWLAAQMILGVDLNTTTDTLTLRPITRQGQTSLRGPVFSAAHWGWMEYSAQAGRTSVLFRMDRYLPAAAPKRAADPDTGERTPFRAVGIRVARVRLPNSQGEMDVQATVGRSTLAGKLQRSQLGLEFVLDAPIELSAGMRIEFILKPRTVTP